MNLVRYLFTASWRLVAMAGAAGLVSGLGGAALIAIIHAALSRPEPSAAVLVWSFVGLCLAVFASRVISEVLLVRLGQDMVAETRLELSRQILAAPLRRLEELGSHRLLATLTDDVAAIATAFVQLPMLGINAAMVVGCLLYLGWLSWMLLTGILGVMALGIAGFQAQQNKAIEALRTARETNDRLFDNLRSLIEGIKELKLHRRRREAFVTEVLERTIAAHRSQFVAGMTRYAVASGMGSLLFYAVVGLLLFVLPAAQGVDVKTVTGYVIVLLYMMTPVERIVDILPLVGRANVAFAKVRRLGSSLAENHSGAPHGMSSYQAAPRLERSPVSSAALPQWTCVQFVGVTHSYHSEQEDRAFSLGPVDVTFHRGELVFLIGGNGSGKTTLAMLLLGLYEPTSGEIRLDGRPVKDIGRESYQELFSAVFADFHLFESLIGLERSQLDEAAREYLARFNLAHHLRVESGLLSTLALSQGQRKRLALLTAYLEDRSFYVFDEWAADQDPVFRSVFYTQLLPGLKAKGKTILVISHDDRYFGVADRCIRMELGTISEIVQPDVATARATPLR